MAEAAEIEITPGMVTTGVLARRERAFGEPLAECVLDVLIAAASEGGYSVTLPSASLISSSK